MTDFNCTETEMHNSGIQSRSGGGVWWTLSLTVLLCVNVVGCRNNAGEQVWGQYRMNVNAAMDDPLIAHVRPEVSTSLRAFAQGLSESLVYDFRADGCAYIRQDERMPFECEYIRTEKSDIVVLRSTDAHGRASYLRLRPVDGGIELNRLNHTLTLERLSE